MFTTNFVLPPIHNLIAKVDPSVAPFNMVVAPMVMNMNQPTYQPQAQETIIDAQRSNSIRKSKFTPEEDKLLTHLVSLYGTTDWNFISSKMISRNPRQCRERWNNYLNPCLTAEPWTIEEDRLLVAKYRELGSHWSKISKFFVRRSDNAVRNRWQLLLRQSEKRAASSSSNQTSDD